MFSVKFKGLYKYLKNNCTYCVVGFANYKVSADSKIERIVILKYVNDAEGFHDSSMTDDAILFHEFVSSGHFIEVDDHGNEIKEDDAPKCRDVVAPNYTTSIWD
ncbi:MAG: hypothetical protein NC320_01625 [Clostridium sp.]|nr:hypothetical protein [Clostridium sp.]